VTKDEDEKKADPVMQEVQDNAFTVGGTKDEEKKKAGPATQKVHDNNFVVGADPGNTNIITIAAPKRAEDGTDGNVRQKRHASFENLESEILPRIRYNECEEENRDLEFRNEGSPGSFGRDDEPRCGF